MAVLSKKHIPDSYLALIRAFPLRRITSGTEHARAKTVLQQLFDRKRDRGANDYLDVLIDLIADYEKRSGQAVDTSAVSAADLVRHRVEERQTSVSALARDIGIPQSNLSEMLGGKRDWSKSAIRALSRKFNIRAERFL